MRSNDDKVNTADFKHAKIVSTYKGLAKQYSENDDIVSRLTRRLQTSLDTRKILELFAEELSSVIDYQQFSYTNEAMLTLKFGERSGVHSCQFNLRLDNTQLGSIKLSRKTRFAEEEMAIVERLASTLVFPLNNARMYHNALQSALEDELTGLGNKRALHAQLHREAERSLRNNTPLSVILLDLDYFKKINDTFGHVAGDQVLRTMAKTLKAHARQSDACFRYGGEEFLIVLESTQQIQAMLVAERLREAIEKQNFYFGNQHIPMTASFGVASYQSGELLEGLISRADKALYEAKSSGRNKVVAEQKELKGPKKETTLTQSA